MKANEKWRRTGFAGPLALIFPAIDMRVTGRRKPMPLP
jgi:hypothetical protein